MASSSALAPSPSPKDRPPGAGLRWRVKAGFQKTPRRCSGQGCSGGKRLPGDVPGRDVSGDVLGLYLGCFAGCEGHKSCLIYSVNRFGDVSGMFRRYLKMFRGCCGVISEWFWDNRLPDSVDYRLRQHAGAPKLLSFLKGVWQAQANMFNAPL